MAETLLDLIERAYTENWSELDLAGWGTVEIPSQIAKLKNLQKLNISGNIIATISPGIKKLRKLREVVAHKCPFFEPPDILFELQQLRSLDLSDNEWANLSPKIGNLVNLTSLDLSGNELTNLPTEIGELQNLKNLNINYNKISELPSTIGRLIHLETLELARNNLTQLPSEVRSLKKLIKLDLYKNNLRKLPREISNLSKLEFLDLTQNQLEELPDELGELSSLIRLNLSGNQLSEIPFTIGNLQNLKTLMLGTYVDTDYDIMPLEEIEDKKVETNKLSSLPAEIQNLTGLKCLDLNDNRLPLPPEILEDMVPHRIISYYFELQKEKRRQILECKLLIVGQGSIGKTSLVQQILHSTFDQHQTKTEGISINQWLIDSKGQQPIKLNIWDFGGQEIMHATHQFFLTKRSLYVLVLDSRLTQEENRVEYWLKIIQSFSDESPVLIVGNKTDQHPLDIDRTGLQKKYPNIMGILETSAATGAGIKELKDAITEQVNNLPHVRDLLPETWFTVKTKLEELGRESNFITHDKYLELCAENEVSDETSQRTLIGFLHDLGVVLHFQDDPRLEALGILNPQWVTNGVYKILNSHTLFLNKGVLTTSMLDEILDLPEYPRGKRLFIVDMMKKFELCYDIEADKTFLVPDLLPKDEPAELKFNGIPAFEYAYPVLPSSVITRFIVRMNKKIDDGFVWRTGVALKIGDNTALVKADIEDRKITVAIDGLEHTRRDALSAIRYQLDEIHGSIKGLNPQKRVPVQEAPNAESLDYDYLLQLERDGFDELPVKDGNRLVKVDVRKLLSGIESEVQRKQSAATITNIYVSGSVTGSNIIVGDENTIAITRNLFKQIYHAIEESPRETTQKTKLAKNVNDIENEVVKGEQANESFLTRRLRNLKKTAPDIADVALAALTSPGAAVGMVVQKIAKKIKDETK